ncbi:MAG: twitching motility protein PilT [Acidobacteria bacterium 13_2_20CM_2_66_4]|nr:MAG: twitching motility protein PilT [Acidobacteria bacterium 13_2_20CM_2_66_4]
MRLLLDTHAALWWMNADKRLSAPARKAIASLENERTLSIAAAWEMAVKSSLGRLKLPLPFGSFLAEHLPQSRIAVIAITIRDLARVEMLPFHHRDPFDRLMAAQALERSLTVVSADPIFEQYGVDRVW